MKKLYSLFALLLLNIALVYGQPPCRTTGYSLNLVKQTDDGSKLLVLYHFKGGAIWDLIQNKKIATTNDVQATHYDMEKMPFFKPYLSPPSVIVEFSGANNGEVVYKIYNEAGEKQREIGTKMFIDTKVSSVRMIDFPAQQKTIIWVGSKKEFPLGDIYVADHKSQTAPALVYKNKDKKMRLVEWNDNFYLSDNGRYLLTSFGTAIDLEKKKLLWKKESRIDDERVLLKPSFSKDGNQFAIAGSAGYVGIYDMQAGKEMKRLELPPNVPREADNILHPLSGDLNSFLVYQRTNELVFSRNLPSNPDSLLKSPNIWLVKNGTAELLCDPEWQKEYAAFYPKWQQATGVRTEEIKKREQFDRDVAGAMAGGGNSSSSGSVVVDNPDEIDTLSRESISVAGRSGFKLLAEGTVARQSGYGINESLGVKQFVSQGSQYQLVMISKDLAAVIAIMNGTSLNLNCDNCSTSISNYATSYRKSSPNAQGYYVVSLQMKLTNFQNNYVTFIPKGSSSGGQVKWMFFSVPASQVK